jgi:membrane glycosyltransferase
MFRRACVRRGLFFSLTLLTAGAASALLLDVLRANGLSAIELLGALLYFALFTWIAGALWTAVAGFGVRLAGGDPAGIDLGALAGRPLRTRAALVMPVCNENPRRVAAGLEATWSSLRRQPEQAAFDLYILSDTSDPEIAAAEQVLWQQLIARHQAAGRVHYRRRLEHRGRKAGNIADFIRTWGEHYECMIVLDADSIMTGAAVVTLVRVMEAYPRIGIAQSLPLSFGRETLFGRLIQFGSRLLGPMLASGLAYWQLGESNYWGHNAIVRLRPFARYCTLPRLSGNPPLGGEILSHDFVEAALMRRGGFEVRQLPDLEGSFEEVPANVLDFAARDRRWTQGNLQHSRLLRLPRLHPLSRLHLVTGIVSYVSSPMWLALLLLSSALSAIEAARLPQYFVSGFKSLVPRSPQIHTGEQAMLFAVTLLVLLLPKILGAALAIHDRRLCRQFGGVSSLCVSLLVEQLFSILLAPSMMLFHSTFVAQTLLGKSVSWDAQVRTDRGVSWREACQRQKWHLAFGAVWAVIMWRLAPQFFWWLMPVLAGLVFGVGLTAWTSRTSAGRLLRHWGLLLVPEETAPPRELRAVSRGRGTAAPAGAIAVQGSAY